MNRYLVFAGGVLLGVLLVVVGVFVYLQLVLGTSSGGGVKANSGVGEKVSPVDQNVTTSSGDEGGATADAESAPLVRDPIPLSRLPLTDTQKQLVKGIGIDYDTFMITPQMVDCAEGSLGRGRVEELISGASPSFSELAVITKCL